MKKWNSNLNKKIKICLFMFLISLFTIIPTIIFYIKRLEKCFNTSYNLINVNNIFNVPRIIINNPRIFFIYLILMLIFIMLYFCIKNTKANFKHENEGINYKEKDGTHGTANFTKAEDLKEIVKIGNEENTNGIILGKTLDTNEIIILPDENREINRNIIILGASGSGKSRKFIVPNILKIAEQEERREQIEDVVSRGKNFICTDPKGELYSKTCKLLEKKGYQVKIFNLAQPMYSDGVDLIKFIENEVDAQVFAKVVMEATQNIGTKKGDEFWQITQENLLKALLLHIFLEVEDENKKNMGYLYSILSSGDIKKVDRVFSKSKNKTKIAYNIYAQATDVIKQSVITGLATKLQIFQLDEINTITKRNDIDFARLNDEKICIFCVISDMDTTMNYLNSLFFSFLFIKLIRMADNSKERRLKRDLVLYLDEFPNIGQIPDFKQKLATIRSRGISAVIVCQNISGIEGLYPNNGWQGLVGNTDIKIVMGLNDIQSADYVSKVLGVSTVENNSLRKTAGFDGKLDLGKEGIATTERNLLNPDEILRMDNDQQIVIIRGQKPFICKKFDYSEYWMSKEMEEVEISEYKEKITIDERIIEKEEKLPTFEEFIHSKKGE